MRAWDYAAEMRRLHKMTEGTSDLHGTARWGTGKDAKAAGMFKHGGIVLGRLNGKLLSYSGPAHALTLAPTRAGKGVSQIVPTCLTNPSPMIINDVKAQNYAVSARFRREVLGHRIVCICPHHKRLNAELGLDIEDAGHNMLSIVRLGPDVRDNADLVALVLIPGKPLMSESETFFVRNARSLLAGSMLHLLTSEPEAVLTLPRLRRELSGAGEGLVEFIANMAASKALGGVVAEYGHKLVEAMESQKQFQGILASACEPLDIYDGYSPLGKHVSEPGFDFRELDGGPPTTVYIIQPSDRPETQAAWLNAVFSLAIEVIARRRNKGQRIWVQLDELGACGYMPVLHRAMTQYAGAGLSLHLVAQGFGMLERIYGKGYKELVEQCEVISAFGIRELQTLETLSKMLGSETVANWSWTSGAAHRVGQDQDVSVASSEARRPLLLPEEVRTMPSDRLLILHTNKPPFFAEKIDYTKLREWRLRRRADEDPYHRKGRHGRA